jgi:hypothetical protein
MATTKRILKEILTVLLICVAFLPGSLSFLPEGNAGQQDQKSDEEGFKIKVDVDLVTTDIAVAGDAVPEFRAEDLILYDNNIAQPLSYFSRDQLPITSKKQKSRFPPPSR